MPTTEEPLWESTTVQNLIRYRPSGTYFARFKVGGKLIRQTLDTAVFSVARQRLPDKIREYRSRHESVKAFANGKMTVGDAVEVYLGKVRSSVSLKPRSKERRRYALGWSQSVLATKLQIAGFDISRSGVSKIEARLSYVDDKTLLYLAEVLKVQVQELFPTRPPGNRIYDFIEKLETTRF
jgi:hypothetical protein